MVVVFVVVITGFMLYWDKWKDKISENEEATNDNAAKVEELDARMDNLEDRVKKLEKKR